MAAIPSAFVLSFAHSGFVAVLVSGIIPVLMTIMYENKRMTTGVAILCMISQFISGYSTFWDPEKVFSQSYIINLIILMSATVCVAYQLLHDQLHKYKTQNYNK